jgi:glutamyl-tRNA reductase
VLLVGAGRIGELAAGNLSARGASIAFVANRTPESAAELAGRFGGVPISLDDVALKLGEVDVVLTSTAAPGLLIERRDIPSRRRHPLFFIDIAVPRDVDPSVHDLDGCFLYDIDDLEAVVSETLEGRRAEAEVAERLVVEETERFREWRASLDVVPAISALRAHAEEIRTAELDKLPTLADGELERLDQVTAQIVAKLLHEPTVRMKEAAAEGGGEAYAAAIRRLFGLDEPR